MALEDYKDVVGSAAGICTILQMFSGVFICRDIVKQGNTKNIPVIPFLGGLVLGALMGFYARMLGDDTMITVNIAGISLNVCYMLCYTIYCQDKTTLIKQTLKGFGFVMLMLGYIRWEDEKLVEFRFGLVVTALLMVVIASPLFSLGEVIRTQSTATLPFPMIFSGTIVSFLWLLYGIILKNNFVLAQNVLGLVLCLIQLSLFVIYPGKPSGKPSGKTE